MNEIRRRAEERRRKMNEASELLVKHKIISIGPDNAKTYLMLHPSTTITDGWQVSFFDEHGPIGHSESEDMGDAITDAFDQWSLRNVEPVSEQEFIEVSTSPSFREGTMRVQFVGLMNRLSYEFPHDDVTPIIGEAHAAPDIQTGIDILRSGLRRLRGRKNPATKDIHGAGWAHPAVQAELEETSDRAVEAGAAEPLEYVGAGMTGVVYQDANGVAFKVYRRVTPIMTRMAIDEYEWLVTANSVDGVAPHVPDVYEFDRENLVLIREMVEGQQGGWGTPGLMDMHASIEDWMVPHGWSAPEFKEDSYVKKDDGTLVLVDASMPHRLCDRALRYVQQILSGYRPWYDETPDDLAFMIRRELSEGCVDADAAMVVLESLYDRGAIKG